jgi:hypothetical protein
MYGTQVTGNRIDNLGGNGILVKRRTVLSETIISENQLLNLGGAGISMEPGTYAIDMNITLNSAAMVGLASTPGTYPSGIMLSATVVNLNITDNALKTVGPDPTFSASRAGILLMAGADVRITGNRIIDIGPQAPVNASAGIFPYAILGRLVIADNEVRRASVPLLNGDASQWSALLIGVVLGDVSVRGNLLESFGSTPTAVVLLARSCMFSDNHCLLDNPLATPLPTIAVRLGVDQSLNAGAIIASNNLVQTPAPPHDAQVVMILNPLDGGKTMTVLGNITSGIIKVGTSDLGAPWAPLNAINV